ncbi:polysaccharide pyruvyl transferase CsaB [[Limnothrix rosea] IAM M-220]|uniref:polysaccharide pyruvyl transferase CsaB n=1 Tax=[Limnothrix rosea] IAM M-220 TaxID=454133 RepID=UPI0009606980|nr:polysaccharide pyruvyl transferase CsaB [[Limnothrix rosea] IAM M-220]OKH19970.1 polysaccharide pyruvyl transferase CsaB [[Limnothrix rosea] IAM M-220]
MTKVVLCGYYGHGNAGDEALLVTLLQMLPTSVEPIVLSHNPAVTTAAYGIPAVKHKSLEALKAIAASDGFVWGGGSLMQDVSSLASPIYYGGLMKFAQLLGKKTIAWGQGIGPLNSAIAQWITRFCLKSCKAVSVRDQASSDLLKSWHIEHILAPDPVWKLGEIPFDQDLDFPHPRVAVNLRSHHTLTPEKLAVLTEALKIFQRQLNATIVLVPFQESQDGAIAAQLYEQLEQPKTIAQISKPQQFKSLFQQVDFLIGMRLHSLIIASSAGCACSALSYDPKVTQLQNQCDIPGFNFEMLPKDAGAIADSWFQQFQASQNRNSLNINAIQKDVQQHKQLLALLS